MGKVKLSGVEVKFTEEDTEMFDYVVDDILDNINAIRDELTSGDEFIIEDILNYFDKLCEIVIQLSDDHKVYVIFVNQTMSIVKQLVKKVFGGDSKTVISKDEINKIKSMFS